MRGIGGIIVSSMRLISTSRRAIHPRRRRSGQLSIHGRWRVWVVWVNIRIMTITQCVRWRSVRERVMRVEGRAGVWVVWVLVRHSSQLRRKLMIVTDADA